MLVLWHFGGNHYLCTTTTAQAKPDKWTQEIVLENRKLSEQLKKLSQLNADGNAEINELRAQVRKLEQENETLHNEVQIGICT